MKTEMIPLSQITPAPFQPRKTFDPEKMEELAISMESQGLLHPILVRPFNGVFQLIAGERRFRAAKALGWKDIRAEIEDMNDLKAEEKSFVENKLRDDLDGEQTEDAIYSMWEKGKPDADTEFKNTYQSKEQLSKMLGYRRDRVSVVLSACKSRERLNFKSAASSGESMVTTFDLAVTSSITNDEDRKKLITLKTDEKITTAELVKYAPVVRDSSVAVKDAVLDKPKMFTPAVAKELSKLSDTVQLGTIAAIKKGKMDEETAVRFTAVVHESKPDVQDAMMADPTHITPAVATELSKLSTPEAQRSTIAAITSHRLKEDEALGVTKMMSDQSNYSRENIDAVTEREREFAKLQREYEQNKTKLFSGGKQRVGRAFQNILAHMKLVQAVHSDGCSCPHCGKEGAKYLRWTCCDDGKKEVIDAAYQYARKQHEIIVKEEKKEKKNEVV